MRAWLTLFILLAAAPLGVQAHSVQGAHPPVEVLVDCQGDHGTPAGRPLQTGHDLLGLYVREAVRNSAADGSGADAMRFLVTLHMRERERSAATEETVGFTIGNVAYTTTLQSPHDDSFQYASGTQPLWVSAPVNPDPDTINVTLVYDYSSFGLRSGQTLVDFKAVSRVGGEMRDVMPGGSRDLDGDHACPAANGRQTTFPVEHSTVANQAPVPEIHTSAGPFRGGDLLTLTGSAFDPEGDAITDWSWDLGDGRSHDEQDVQVRYAIPGEYKVVLTATDALGATGTTDLLVKVHNNPPRADFVIEGQPTLGQATFFSDKSIDLDGAIVQWDWDFGDESGSTKQHPSHIYRDPGEYTITLQVWDDRGDTDWFNHTIQVADPDARTNTPPTSQFRWLPERPTPHRPVTFEDLSFDDVGIASWAWDFGDGSFSHEQNPNHTYERFGRYRVQLTVQDTDNVFITSFRDITIYDPVTFDDRVYHEPPIADFVFTPPSAIVGQPLLFSDRSTDPDGQIQAVYWDWGDATDPGVGPSVEHAFAKPGQWPVTVTVTDIQGMVASKTKIVVIHAPGDDAPFAAGPGPDGIYGTDDDPLVADQGAPLGLLAGLAAVAAATITLRRRRA